VKFDIFDKVSDSVESLYWRSSTKHKNKIENSGKDKEECANIYLTLH